MSKPKVGVVLAAVALVVAGCGTLGGVNTYEIPDWYLHPPTSKDTIYGVGTARMSTLDMSRTASLGRARDDVARQVQTEVKNALTNYGQQAGEGANQQAVQYFDTVSRQVAKVTLSGCRTEQVAVTSDGTVYSMVSYAIASLKETAMTEFQRNEAAAFAEFKATEALKQLEQELQNNPPKAGASGN